MADLYREKVIRLEEALTHEDGARVPSRRSGD
jgi:hypothetical protein